VRISKSGQRINKARSNDFERAKINTRGPKKRRSQDDHDQDFPMRETLGGSF
jgi:hypothetical protein